MPEEKVTQQVREDAREGKAPSTQAGEFVGEEIDHVRSGKHGARSVKQAIAIGLSKARKAGVKLPPNPNNSGAEDEAVSRRTRNNAERTRKRSRASMNALRQERTGTVSRKAISAQVKAEAKRRGSRKRHAAARKAAKTRSRTSSSNKR